MFPFMNPGNEASSTGLKESLARAWADKKIIAKAMRIIIPLQIQLARAKGVVTRAQERTTGGSTQIPKATQNKDGLGIVE